MSTALAIAAVTAVLKDLLQNGVIDRGATAGVGNVAVSALPPDRVPLEAQQDSRLNLYMYCVTPNQGWRNVDYPAYNSRGDRIANPPLALDLHYLITAYGNEEFHSEILLGFAMQILHENPILQRAAVETALNPQINVGASSPTELPPTLKALRASDLAEQVETIKITPRTLDSEEISRLWGAFQAHYRPTMAYLASVVLIQSEKPVRPTMPVLQSNLVATTLRHPRIESVTPTDGSVITPQSLVELSGSGFSGDTPAIQVDAQEIDAGAITTITDAKVRITLPTGLRAGAHGIQLIHAVHFGANRRVGERSNVAPFVLHPIIQPNGADYWISIVNVHDTGDGTRTAEAVVLVTPQVEETQQALLELVRVDGTLLMFHADTRTFATNTLEFFLVDVPPGNYFVRVRIDGAESPFRLDANGQPSAPQRNIP